MEAIVLLSQPKGWGYDSLFFTVDDRAACIPVDTIEFNNYLTVVATQGVASLAKVLFFDGNRESNRSLATFDDGQATNIIVMVIISHFANSGWRLISHSVVILPNDKGPMVSFVFDKQS